MESQPNEKFSYYMKPKWEIKSGCHFSCMDKSTGIQIVTSDSASKTNIQLCHPDSIVRNNESK